MTDRSAFPAELLALLGSDGETIAALERGLAAMRDKPTIEGLLAMRDAIDTFVAGGDVDVVAIDAALASQRLDLRESLLRDLAQQPDALIDDEDEDDP